MTYAQSLQYLNSFLNLERIVCRPDNRLWNLKRMELLLDLWGHPEENFFPILIAGTKGKGSTGFFLESILHAASIPVGFYSSPHLETPLERIRLCGKNVSREKWVRGLGEIKRKLKDFTLPKQCGDFTYFEIMTLLAVLLFRASGVKIGIFEIGMGGRLDAANALEAKIALITSISLDHEAFLGDTIGKIAGEKAAIIRTGSDVVIGRQPREAETVIRRQVACRKANLWRAPTGWNGKLGLPGEFQKPNAAIACMAACLLHEKYGFPIPEHAVRLGVRASDWPGRFEIFPGRPEFLLDVAHNPSSIEELAKSAEKRYPKRPKLILFGVSRDKRSGVMLRRLSRLGSDIILCQAVNPRSLETSFLMTQARRKFSRIFPIPDVPEAVRLARRIARPENLVIVTGSFYLVGEVRKLLRQT